MAQLLGSQGLWQHQICRDTDCFCCRSYDPIRVFFRASYSWPSEDPSGQSFSIAPPFRPLEGSLAWDPSQLFSTSGTQKGALAGVLLCSSVSQAFDGPASVLFICGCWRVGRERLGCWLHPLRVAQQHRLASMAAWLSSTGISHHSSLPSHPFHLSLRSQQQPSN